MQWRTEIERRWVSVTELAAAAGVHPVTARRIVKGERVGWPRSRRALHTALTGFPVIAEPDGTPAAAPANGVDQAASVDEAVRLEHQRRLERLAQLKESP